MNHDKDHSIKAAPGPGAKPNIGPQPEGAFSRRAAT